MKSPYGIKSLRKDFPNEAACLDFLFDALHSRSCSCGGTYKPLFKMAGEKFVGRRQYQCSKCRYQIAPTAGTVFHKSDTPLQIWLHAILVFSNAKSGISAKQMERELEVTYKTAWRILMLIRKALKQSSRRLKGDVEMDSAYFGGKADGGRNNENLSQAMKKKAVLMGAVERRGSMRLKVVSDASAKTHGDFLKENVEPAGTRLMTDRTRTLDKVAVGYDRHMVDHSRDEYVRGDVYVNTMDAFWAHVKRSIRGTHKVISKKHLQAYLDGFVFHYNNRRTDKERFVALLGNLLYGAA